MKRFAATICLAACLVFLCGGIAMAANSVVVESKTVGTNATGVTAGVYVSNDIAIQGLVAPFELRTNTGGAYIAGPGGANNLKWEAPVLGSRIDLSPLGSADPGGAWPIANITKSKFAVPGAQTCSGPTSSSWPTAAANVDFVSPDAVFLATVSTGNPNIGEKIDLDPGADASGSPSLRMTFNVNGSLGDFVIDTACVTPANHLSYVDMNSNLVFPTFTMGVITIANSCPINLAINPPAPSVTVGGTASGTLSATDPEGDPFSWYMVTGNGSIAGNVWSYGPTTCADAPGFDVTVMASDKGPTGCPNATLTFHVTVNPAPLAFDCGAGVSVHWNAAAVSKSLTATGGCPPYVFSVVSGKGGVTGNTWSYTPACGDVGAGTVTLRVTDAAQNTKDCTFDLAVTNADVATCTNPDDIQVEGSRVLGPAGPQADGDALTYSLVSGTGWAGEGITGNTYSSGTRVGTSDVLVTFMVSDGCTSQTCSFYVRYKQPCIKVVDVDVLSGATVTVDVAAEVGSIPGEAGGYDLLICYDRSGLSFLNAAMGDIGWEYFTYRTGMFGGNCGSGCPSGYVRLVAIADMNNGTPLPPANFAIDGKVLARLTFYVSADLNYINSCFHVGFCAYDCSDNAISSKDGYTTWIPQIADNGVTFDGAYPAECPSTPKNQVVYKLHFCEGRICVRPPVDDRGDLNLNGIPNEIGDAVLYSNYFIYGASVLGTGNAQKSRILASDVNADGVPLTVADLIYLIRIITGDAQPYANGQPKLSPYANSVDVISENANGALNVTTNSSVDLGGAVLVYRYSGVTVGTPTLSAAASNMTIKANASNGELRVLVYSNAKGARVNAGSNSLVTIPVSGDGTIELVESQFSDYNGAMLSVTAAKAGLPTEYALLQNYPNPFNAGTVIPFALKGTSEYTLTIYNVAGQAVRTFAGTGTGVVRVAWDGTASDGSVVASGMYFYRVNAGNFSATKKMVLLK